MANVYINTNDVTVVKETYLNGVVVSGYPIGTILMYDGSSWVNNSTMAGWYKCDGTNGTPNLVDKFIKGDSTSGTSGGSHTKTISSNNLPLHTHAVTHSHTASSNSTGAHTHTVSTYLTNGSTTHFEDYYASSTTIEETFTTSSAGAHSHTITVDNYIGSTGNNTSTATAIDIQPAYYTVIYIKRIA